MAYTKTVIGVGKHISKTPIPKKESRRNNEPYLTIGQRAPPTNKDGKSEKETQGREILVGRRPQRTETQDSQREKHKGDQILGGESHRGEQRREIISRNTYPGNTGWAGEALAGNNAGRPWQETHTRNTPGGSHRRTAMQSNQSRIHKAPGNNEIQITQAGPTGAPKRGYRDDGVRIIGFGGSATFFAQFRDPDAHRWLEVEKLGKRKGHIRTIRRAGCVLPDGLSVLIYSKKRGHVSGGNRYQTSG